MALLPILAMVVVLARGAVPSMGQAFLSASFLMSWVGDSLTTYVGNGEHEYVTAWVTAQIAFACLALYRGALNVPILIYFGLGTVALIFYLEGMTSPNVMEFWLFYQACRLAGILSLCSLIFTMPPPKELDRVAYN